VSIFGRATSVELEFEQVTGEVRAGEEAGVNETSPETPENDKGWFEPVRDGIEWLANRIVRSAELILLTAAFGYAASRAPNVGVTLIFGILLIITTFYIEFSVLDAFFPSLKRSLKSKTRPWRMVIHATALLLVLIASVGSIFAVQASLEAMVVASLQ